jgi:hypothetical protein
VPPVDPVAPVEPVTPVLPVLPVDPVAPVDPAGPAGPGVAGWLHAARAKVIRIVEHATEYFIWMPFECLINPAHLDRFGTARMMVQIYAVFTRRSVGRRT